MTPTILAESGSPADEGPTRRVEGITALVLVVAAMALRIAAVDEWSLDLKPRPDAMEYALCARQLARGERPVLDIDGHPYPSRYPYGTPLLFAPFLAAAGGRLEWAHVGALVYSALALWLTYAVGRRLLGGLCGLLALAITAVSPEHARFSVVVMSEIPSELMMLLVVLAWTWASQERCRPLGFLGIGILCGFSGAIRYPNLLILACVLGDVIACARRGVRGAVPSLLLLVIGSGLALGGQLLYNRAVFGSPFEDGYRYWEPDDYRSGHALSPAYLFQAFADDGRLGQHGNFVYYALALIGAEKALYRPEIFLLAVAGAVLAVLRAPRRALWFLLALPLLAVAFYGCYFFRAYRMLVPVLPFLAMLAALPIAWLVTRLARTPRSRIAVLALPIFVIVARQWGPLSSLVDDARREREHAFLPAFRALGDRIDRSALVIWDLPLALGSSLCPGVELMPLTGDGVDRHLAWILKHRLLPLDGDQGEPVPLFLDRTILHPPSYLQLVQASRAGRRILLVHGYLGAAPEMKNVLARYFATRPYAPGGEPLFARGLWAFELVPLGAEAAR